MTAMTAIAALLLAGLAPLAAQGVGSGAAPSPAAEERYGNLWNILPPGSNGNATAVDLVTLGGTATNGGTEATPDTPTNFADQLEMYDALTTKAPSAIRRTDLETLYKRNDFTPDQVVSTSTPREGVTIERDSFGVPFITGVTFADVEYGAGYAAIEDRMFLMDVLRHIGQARLAEFVGDSPENVAMDQAQLRSAFYTEEEASAQVEKAAVRAGTGGPRLLAGVDAFIEGINAAQSDLCPVIVAPSCPVEYAALQKLPEDWDRADVVYVASLVGGIFGKGGGQEVENAAWLKALTEKFGPRKAVRVYNDLREKNDSEAPTTGTIPTAYDRGGLRPGLPGVALPDVGAVTAPGTGSPVGRTQARQPGVVEPRIELPGGESLSLSLKSRGMSNALVVGGEHTDTGKPLAVFGPQTGYFAPQLLVEQVLMGPGVMARGVSFAGTNLVVQLGRGLDYAWSATSAGSDNVDTVVERLCNTDGTKPSVKSTGYRVGKRCKKMDRFIHSETTTPNAGSPSPPKTYEFLVLRTKHGLVQHRTTVNGKPVAIASQRSTYGHEVDSVLGFAELNNPDFVDDAASFQKAVADIDFTFNWFYADNRDISFYSSGLLPVRSELVEPDLPRWAGSRYDWQGWLSSGRHPRQTNPPNGYFVSWNNKPAPGFSAADDNWSYGPVYRSLALEARLKKALAGGTETNIAGLVGVMSAAATADSRARYTLPLLLKVIGKDPKTARARKLLQAWIASGAQRVDRDRDGSYAHEQAIAIFDTWWEDGKKSVAYDVLKSKLGNKLVRALPEGIDDHPRLGLGSAWNGIAWYGYLNKDLRSVLGRKVGSPYTYSYCGNGRLGACRTQLRTSLRNAVTRVLAAQETTGVGALTYDKTEDQIISVPAGVVGVRPIDWQNRPTFQMVVEFLTHRPR